MPAVQNPHCSAWCSWKDSCSRPCGRPSIVVMSAPSTWTANVRHDAHGLAVELHRARAARPVLAADLRAGEPELVAKEVREERARLDLGRVVRPVDAHETRTTRPERGRGRRVGRRGRRGRGGRRGVGGVRSPGGRGRAAGRRSRSRAARFDERAAGQLGDERAAVVAVDEVGGERGGVGGGRAVAQRGLGGVGAARRRGPRPRRGPRRARPRRRRRRSRPGCGRTRRTPSSRPSGSGGTSIETSSSRGPSVQRAAHDAPRSRARSARPARSARRSAPRVGRRARPSRRPSRASASPGGRRARTACAQQRPAPARRASSARAPPGGRSRRSAASPPVRRITPGMPLMSTSRAGRTSRRFSSGTRLCPPASTRASASSAAAASSHEATVTYSNGAGFTGASAWPATPARPRRPRRRRPSRGQAL